MNNIFEVCDWLREPDLNQRPSGYEPDELPNCSIPRQKFKSFDLNEVRLYLDLIKPRLNLMDGVEGFEPPNNGTKNRCLTAWRYPNRYKLTAYVDGIIAPYSSHVKGFERKSLKKFLK